MANELVPEVLNLQQAVQAESPLPESWCDLSLTNADVVGVLTPFHWVMAHLVGADMSLNVNTLDLHFLTAGVYVITVHLALDVSSDADGQIKLTTGGQSSEFGYTNTPTPMTALRPTVHVGGWYMEQTITLDVARWSVGDYINLSAAQDNWEAGNVTLDLTTMLHVHRIS